MKGLSCTVILTFCSFVPFLRPKRSTEDPVEEMEEGEKLPCACLCVYVPSCDWSLSGYDQIGCLCVQRNLIIQTSHKSVFWLYNVRGRTSISTCITPIMINYLLPTVFLFVA